MSDSKLVNDTINRSKVNLLIQTENIYTIRSRFAPHSRPRYSREEIANFKRTGK